MRGLQGFPHTIDLYNDKYIYTSEVYRDLSRAIDLYEYISEVYRGFPRAIDLC